MIGETVYQAVENHGLYALDASSLEQLWHHDEAWATISATDQHAHLLATGEILQVDSASGTVTRRVAAPGVDLVIPNAVSGAMFLASRDGRILCAQQRHVPFLRFEQLSARPLATPTATAGTAGEDASLPRRKSQRTRLRDLLSNESESFILGQDR